MNFYKLKQGKSRSYEITDKENFEKQTGNQQTYFQPDQRNYPFAVCPHCDCPIRIIGFYKEIKPKPYAEHWKFSIKNLADFIVSEYELCPYVDKRTSIPKETKRKSSSPVINKIKSLLAEQYDRIIYIIEKETGICILDNLAEEMMKNFTQSRSWDYAWITLDNLPWTFAYMQVAQTLYGRKIKTDNILYENLKNHPKVYLKPLSEKTVQVQFQNGFLDIKFYFTKHIRKIINDVLQETLNFVVTIDNKIIFEQKINVKENYFINMVSNPKLVKRYRLNLLDIAQKYIKTN
jgi:hypothetical protein